MLIPAEGSSDAGIQMARQQNFTVIIHEVFANSFNLTPCNEVKGYDPVGWLFSAVQPHVYEEEFADRLPTIFFHQNTVKVVKSTCVSVGFLFEIR